MAADNAVGSRTVCILRALHSVSGRFVNGLADLPGQTIFRFGSGAGT